MKQAIEYFHGRIMDSFHEYRTSNTDKLGIELNGSDLNKIIAKAKMDTYYKFNITPNDKH